MPGNRPDVLVTRAGDMLVMALGESDHLSLSGSRLGGYEGIMSHEVKRI